MTQSFIKKGIITAPCGKWIRPSGASVESSLGVVLSTRKSPHDTYKYAHTHIHTIKSSSVYCLWRRPVHAQLGVSYSVQHETSSEGLSSLLRFFTLRSDYEVNTQVEQAAWHQWGSIQFALSVRGRVTHQGN